MNKECNKIHLIMPMAGKGSRFLEEGFEIPKPLINIYDKPFFYWSTQSIKKFVKCIDIIFIVLKEHVEKYSIDKEIKKYFSDAKIIIIDNVLNGATLTALEAIKSIEDDMPIIINDCDHMFKSQELYEYCKQGINETDGIIITFKSDNPKYSYIKTDINGKVIETAEKKVISNNAICGAYYFKNKKVFENIVLEYKKNCDYSELYISGMYNIMIKNNQKVIYMNTDWHIPYGVPEEYYAAKGMDKYYELL